MFNYISSQLFALPNPTSHTSSKVHPLAPTEDCLINFCMKHFLSEWELLYYYSYVIEKSLFSLEIVRKSTIIPKHVFDL